jgi:mannose-6-phosphate isomerase-like protein (cupin superfamily)
LFDPAEDPELPFAAALYRLKPGQRGPAHSHENEVEIYVILGGRGTITFGGKTRELSSESLIWVPPRTVHETVSTGPGDLMILGIFIPPIDFSEIKKNWKRLTEGAHGK